MTEAISETPDISIIEQAGYIQIVIEGIDVVPYTRMTTKGRYSNPQAQKYLANQAAIRDMVVLHMREYNFMLHDEDGNEMPYFPDDVKLSFTTEITRTTDRADLSNLIKALEDALQGVIYKNDLRIKKLSGEFSKGDAPSFWVKVEAID